MNPEIFLPIPETLRQKTPEVVPIPPHEITIAYKPWGVAVNNQQLIRLLEQFGHRIGKDEARMIEATGISKRHHSLPRLKRNEGDPLFPAEEIERQIAIGAEVTRVALKKNKWEGADLLYVATSFLPCPDFPEQIAAQANLRGVQTKVCLLACNGAVAAFHDILRNNNLKEARVVITAVEGLSLGVDFEDENIAIPAIFGNGAASIAFSPQDIRLLRGKTVIVPDKEGVIKVPPTYELPPDEERLSPPDWYELEEGADAVFAYSERGPMMIIPSSDNRYHSQMNNRATAKFFSRKVPPVVCSLGWPEALLGVFHQPSKGVLYRTDKEIRKKQKETNLPPLEIPWVLDEVGMGNTSSVTPLLALAQLEKDGKIPRGKPFNITGFGAGASFTSMIIKI